MEPNLEGMCPLHPESNIHLFCPRRSQSSRWVRCACQVPPSKGHVDHTVATRSRNLAREAARKALEESDTKATLSQAAALSAPRPFEEFRHIRVKARSMEEQAANAHRVAALRPGATTVSYTHLTLPTILLV